MTYRQFNYHLMMSHNTQLARWLRKQLVLKFTFPEMMRPFEMRYSTIKRDSGLLDEYKRERDSIEKVEKAFAELKERRVILDFKRVVLCHFGGSRRLEPLQQVADRAH